MNIDSLTIGEVKEISSLINSGKSDKSTESEINKTLIGKYHIFRTYSAGVFFGKLRLKEGSECIVDECRRLWKWVTKGGISLSEVSQAGLSSNSKVCKAINGEWLDAIEIIPCTDEAINSIQGMPDYVN